MRRDEFEHVIAAAAEVSGEREIVVIGSQAILGSFRDPPQTMLFSAEADVYPLQTPSKAEEIDGSLGRRLLLPRHLWLLRPWGGT